MIKPRPHEIVSATCEVFHISRAQFLGRIATHCFARQVYCYVARSFGHKWSVIGEAMNRGHSSTALWASGVVEKMIADGDVATFDLAALVTSRAIEINGDALSGCPVSAAPERERDRRISTVNDPTHIVWGMRKSIHKQHADFAEAIRAAHPELPDLQRKDKGRF